MEYLSTTEFKCILGYLPATIIKNVIDKKFNPLKDLPQHYLTDSVGLFSDISGFTKLSVAFSKKGRVGPEYLTFCINRYMEQIINIIGANGGDIFKFAGDALMVIWPPDGTTSFLQRTCTRACQCAMDIIKNLDKIELVKGKSLSVKIGIGVGPIHILFVGGLFTRCEYLCVGECMRQAFESEKRSTSGGQIIISENVENYVRGTYNFKEMEPSKDYPPTDDLKYYLIVGKKKERKRRITIKADALKMKKKFNLSTVKPEINTLRKFLPAGVKGYLNIERESWCKELRLITCMFLNIEKDLSQLDNEDTFIQVQTIVNTVQRCIYRTRGALNKFLMDDKGSGMLVAWGVPPFSSRYDPLDCVCSCLTIQHELTKLGLKCGMGVTTGVCFSGVCGTIGNRREYSLIGEVVNLSSRFMSKGLKYREEHGLNSIVVIDEKTQNLIQNKIKCKYLFSYDQLKGFEGKVFHFFEPTYELDNVYPSINNPFPFIKCHCYNPENFNYLNSDIYKDQKYELQKSLMIAGRKNELNAFVSKINEIIEKNIKKFIMIKGEYGSGKSHFIRKGLYTFFNEPKNTDLYNKYINNKEFKKPNIVLCSNQHPFVYMIPFNAVAFIFRQIYKWLNKNIYSKEKNNFEKIKINKNYGNILSGSSLVKAYPFTEITCDSFGKLICKNHCLEYIEIIEEMLSCSKEDISLREHFDENDFDNKLKPIFPSSKLQKQIDEAKKRNLKFYLKKRDPFFTKAQIDDVSFLVYFLMDLLVLYREQIDICYESEKKIPFFLVIEDTQFIDDYSLQFLTKLLNNDNLALKPLIVILSYQSEFRFIKRLKDSMSKRNDFIIPMSLSDFIAIDREEIVNNIQLKNISNVKEIEEMIKIYLLNHGENRTFDSIFRVDQKLIHLLLDKSFKGNPLFMYDLIDELLSKKYIQNCVEEILTTSELDDMELEKDYNEFEIPIRIEKICGEMIDSINEHDIILIKYASVIGNLFDCNTLYNILPFKSMYLNDLYDTLKSFEKRGMIEFLYDLDSKHQNVVCKFACPFLKETLYQRMLIEQRSEIHMQIARTFPKKSIYYLPSKKVEKNYLRKQLEYGQQSIIKGMEEKIEEDNKFTKQSLQILLVHEITEKLKEIKNYGYEDIDKDPEDKTVVEGQGPDKLALAIKYGILEKKSDGKITWEKRFFALTSNKVQYFYHLEEYRQGKVPLGIFNLKDISEIKKLSDYSYGNKKYLFMVSVTRWIKKEKPKAKRSYIFSVKKMEDLYSWLISLNFLRFHAYYETFMVSFGKMDLPLYGYNQSKKKKFIFDIENKAPIVEFKHRKIHKHKTIKLTLKNKNQIDINVIVYDNFLIIKKLIKLCFLNLLGAIQQGIIKDKDSCYINTNQLLLNTLNTGENNTLEYEIKIPQHLSYFGNLRKNSFKSSESGDTITRISQYVSKRKRKKSLALINEDEEEAKKEIFKSDDNDDDSSKDSEKLLFFKKSKRFKESEKESEKISEKLSEIISEKGSEIEPEKESDKESNKESDIINDEKNSNNKKDNEDKDNDDIYITDEENDIEDEDYSSDKNQRLRLNNNNHDFFNNINYMKYQNYNFDLDDYKYDMSKNKEELISFNDSDDDNDDIFTKDKDIDSEDTKVPNYFIKDRNINDFIHKMNSNMVNNIISVDSKHNYYKYFDNKYK